MLKAVTPFSNHASTTTPLPWARFAALWRSTDSGRGMAPVNGSEVVARHACVVGRCWVALHIGRAAHAVEVVSPHDVVLVAHPSNTVWYLSAQVRFRYGRTGSGKAFAMLGRLVPDNVLMRERRQRHPDGASTARIGRAPEQRFAPSRQKTGCRCGSACTAMQPFPDVFSQQRLCTAYSPFRMATLQRFSSLHRSPLCTAPTQAPRCSSPCCCCCCCSSSS